MRFVSSLFGLCLVTASVVAANDRVLGSAEAEGRAQVINVVAGRTSDLVVLAGGYNHGLRPGAVCTVTHAGRPLASIVIAETSAQRAVALILSLDDSAQISSGDIVTLRPNPRI